MPIIIGTLALISLVVCLGYIKILLDESEELKRLENLRDNNQH